MPSDYTVNLGIERIFTGEQSGTWGDTTNTNWDIVDQAINGLVSVTLPAVGSTGVPNDIAITNGALSDGRNRYIDIVDGGDLGGTAYVRITPSDAEKVVHIRNSLTASRSVIIFQGTYNSANDFVIPTGTDVMLKFSGGGASATVTNVFVNLAVAALSTDTINEATTSAGVTVDGMLVKAGGINGTVGAVTPTTGEFTTLSATGTITGPSGTWASTGIDLATTDSYFIATNNVLSQTALGATVLASSLTSLGTIASLVATTADINAGTVDALIGGTTPAAGTFTSVVATTADINAGTVDALIGGTTPAVGTFTTVNATTYTGLPDTSETVSGVIELATQVEVDAGTDAVRAVTPATLAAATSIAATLDSVTDTGNTTTNAITVGVITATGGGSGNWNTAYTVANAALPKAGGAMTGTVTFADNAKATFGAAADLEIYHDGSNSVIKDAGTGNLEIHGEQTVLKGSTSGLVLLQAADAGGITLYQQGATKLATSGTGISVTGAIVASGDVTAFSDIRLKGDIQPISEALDKVSQLRGVTFLRLDEDDGVRHTGLIAQELQTVLPEAVHVGTDDNETLSVAYGNTVGLLIEAIKELNAKMEALNNGSSI